MASSENLCPMSHCETPPYYINTEVIMYKVGDWCVFEFKICQIKEVNKYGHVHLITDDYFEIGSGTGHKIRPLTIRNKLISDEFEAVSKRIYKNGNVGLNYPDIHNYLIYLWLEACDTPETEKGHKRVREIYNQIEEFEAKVIQFSQDSPVIDGISMLRRK